MDNCEELIPEYLSKYLLKLHKHVAGRIQRRRVLTIDILISRLCPRRGRLRGPAPQHLQRNAAAEQNPQGHPQEHRQEVSGALRRAGRGQGELQEVLRRVLKEHQGNSK